VDSAPGSQHSLERLDATAEQELRDQPIPVRPIGYVRTSHHEPADAAIQTAHDHDGRGLLVVFEEFSEGLSDLAGFDYAFVVSFLDRAPDPVDGSPDALRPVPFLLRDKSQRRGVFATRYPVRPNRLALSLVRVEAVTTTGVEFTGVDLADCTPVLDIKPWVARFDIPAGLGLIGHVSCGWYDDLAE